MNKSLLTLCVLLLVCSLSIGGVFAVFNYAQAPVEPKTEALKKEIGEFDYSTAYTFTQGMTDMMNYADGTNDYGLNITAYYAPYYDSSATEITDGVMYVYAQTSYSRASYGYVGSMDSTYGEFFHADTSIAAVMRYVVEVNGENIIYLYMASSEYLNDASFGQSITVFRVGYKYADVVNSDETTTTGYFLIKDSDGNPVIEKGTSSVHTYEGQTGEAKTFGVHNNTEIWQAE